jgi:superfamily I DNA and RNA helicase
MSLSLQRTDEMLLSLTDEQYIIMQGFFANKRMLVSGPAGTGKTLLAMEQCRRLTAEGYRVLYICYNRLISSYVRQVFEIEKKEIGVYTLPKFLMEKTGTIEIKEDDKFFKELLPELFLKNSSDYISEKDKYDAIVIDEGQDLMNTYFILCLEEIVRGGLSNGRWTIYFDKNQNIFGHYEELQSIYNELEDHAAYYSLSVNCRNTKQIAIGNWYATNISQAQIMKAEGENVVFHMFSDKKEERKELFKTIKRLRTEGIGKNDIVILSPYRMDNQQSCLFNAVIPAEIGEIRQNEANCLSSDSFIRFYTVQSYKGLESKIILYIDIDGFREDEERLRNYIAMSRARTLLELFYNKDLEDERQAMMMNTVQDEFKKIG